MFNPTARSGTSTRSDLARSMGFWSGTSLLVGTMIGSGIFRAPASIASVAHDPRQILGMWLFFGIVTICGALTLAELATMLPQTGGIFVYLRAAYGDRVAFVFGWSYILLATPSGMAAGAAFFGELLLGILRGPHIGGGWAIPLIAIAAIVFLSAVNIAGVRYGAMVQNALTCAKVGALLAIVFGALLFGKGEVSRWFSLPVGPGKRGDIIGAATSIMFTYNGWFYVSLVAGEIRNPSLRLKQIILAGTGTVVLLYLCANLAYLYLMPLAAMPGTTVASKAMELVAGPVAGTAITACILASVFGGLNGVILTKARVAYAQGREGLNFAILGRPHPRLGTPYVSILIQCVCSVIFVLALRDPLQPLRLFDRLIACFALPEWLAVLFAIIAVFVLRRTSPDAHRPFLTPGYPIVPLIFVAGTLSGLGAILWSSCSRGDYAPLAGLGIMLAGFPVFWIWRRLIGTQGRTDLQETAR